MVAGKIMLALHYEMSAIIIQPQQRQIYHYYPIMTETAGMWRHNDPDETCHIYIVNRYAETYHFNCSKLGMKMHVNVFWCNVDIFQKLNFTFWQYL